jgi:translation initiation factor IF-2
MSDNATPTTPKKPLTLSGKVKSDLAERAGNRSAGGKSVIVEVKRSRILLKKKDEPEDQPEVPVIAEKEAAKKPAPTPPSTDKAKEALAAAKRLTEKEREARLRALQGASQFAEKQSALLDESNRRAEERRQQLEEQARAEAERKAAETPAEPEEAPAATEKPIDTREIHKVRPVDDEESPHRRLDHKRSTVFPKEEAVWRPGHITIDQARSDDEVVPTRTRSLSSIRRAREKERMKAAKSFAAPEKIVREITIPETITVQELSNRMAEKASAVIKALINMGMMATITQSIDGDTAQIVAEEMGHKVKRVADGDVEEILVNDMDRPEDMQPRAPIVTVMGHVDHGKTSLLDALRQTDVVAGEAGGITQHIGAYQVTTKKGQRITFIDTPGHAAFTEMRARGANVTDIVVLVVAADDGVMPQTIEAINHAKAANVPIIVAINKMDKHDANPQRVKNELLQHEIVLEDFGGDILSCEVSAKEKLNIDKLEELISLQAEILDLKANPKCLAQGMVVEAKLEKGRGPLATILIQKGTLKVGDVFVAGSEWGRVRALINDHGKKIDSVGPAVPVEIMGFDGVPGAGDLFTVLEDEQKAREIAEYRKAKNRTKLTALHDAHKLEHLFANAAALGQKKTLAVLVKSDVQGSAEAISSALQKLSTEEVSVKILHAGVGAITESDIVLAKASRGLVIGFNVRANSQARTMSSADQIEIRYYSIIYDIIDDVKALMGGLLSPINQETYIGRAEIRKIFKVTKVGTIAGCFVTDGFVKRGAKIRLLRDEVVIHEGALKTLKRMQDEVKEVKTGYECGMAFENYEDLREGDVIECSEVEQVARTL